MDNVIIVKCQCLHNIPVNLSIIYISTMNSHLLITFPCVNNINNHPIINVMSA